MRAITMIAVAVAVLASYLIGGAIGDDAEGANVARLQRALDETNMKALVADQDANTDRIRADELGSALDEAQTELDQARTDLDGAHTVITRLKAKQKRQAAAGKLSEADIRRASEYELAIATECLRLAQGRTPTDAEMNASIDAVFELPRMLRRDPDTYYKWPNAGGKLVVRKTLRQVVGQARDSMASGYATPCNEFGARDFATALETLPH